MLTGGVPGHCRLSHLHRLPSNLKHNQDALDYKLASEGLSPAVHSAIGTAAAVDSKHAVVHAQLGTRPLLSGPAATCLNLNVVHLS